MAEQNQLPKLMGSIHKRFFTPYIAILITAALMLFLTLKSSFVQALTISTLARLVTYGATCLALPLFRYRGNAQPPAFHLPGGTVIAILALLLIIWLLAHSTLKEAQATAIAAGVGLLIYVSYWFYSRSS